MEKRLNCWEYKNCGYGPDENKKKARYAIPFQKTDLMEFTAVQRQAGLAGW